MGTSCFITIICEDKCILGYNYSNGHTSYVIPKIIAPIIQNKHSLDILLKLFDK